MSYSNFHFLTPIVILSLSCASAKATHSQQEETPPGQPRPIANASQGVPADLANRLNTILAQMNSDRSPERERGSANLLALARQNRETASAILPLITNRSDLSTEVRVRINRLMNDITRVTTDAGTLAREDFLDNRGLRGVLSRREAGTAAGETIYNHLRAEIPLPANPPPARRFAVVNIFLHGNGRYVLSYSEVGVNEEGRVVRGGLVLAGEINGRPDRTERGDWTFNNQQRSVTLGNLGTINFGTADSPLTGANFVPSQNLVPNAVAGQEVEVHQSRSRTNLANPQDE